MNQSLLQLGAMQMAVEWRQSPVWSPPFSRPHVGKSGDLANLEHANSRAQLYKD
jgi:hypothetical protein